MLKNYFKIAVRNLKKYKLPSAINIGGLAIGMAVCILLFLYVSHELNYDDFHESGSQIYRVTYHPEENKGDRRHLARTPPLLIEELAATYPAIEKGVRIARKELSVSTMYFDARQEKVEFADPQLFDVFSFELIKGNPEYALNNPGNAVITEEVATLYFGRANPIGKTITIGMETGPIDFTITGILEDIPDNSSLQFHVILPFQQYANTYSSYLRSQTFESWSMPLPMVESYILLNKEASVDKLEFNFPSFVDTYWDDDESCELRLQPLSDIHMDPTYADGIEPTGRPLYAWLITVAALVVLAIACINYITLMLGRSVDRAREVGIRKAIGAGRRQIMYQFWGEAFLTTIFAFALGLVFSELFLPMFNNIVDLSLTTKHLNHYDLWLIAMLIILLITLLIGGYPAYTMSKLKAAQVLKGKGGIKGKWVIVKVLVVIQFACTVALLASILGMHLQLKYISEKDLGFNQEGLIRMPISGSDNSGSLFTALKHVSTSSPNVKDLTGSFFSYGHQGLDLDLTIRREVTITTKLNLVADNYIKTLGIRLAKGHNLTEVSGKRQVLINQTLASRLGIDDPIGHELPVHENDTMKELFHGMTIAGVVEDYNSTSLHEHVEPLILAPASILGDVMIATARIENGNLQNVLSEFRSAWKKAAPNIPFQYEFLEDVVAAQYTEDRRWQTVINYSGVLILIIACFGLNGLTMLSIQQRIKEIGIRKVLGASVLGIITFLSKNYAKLVLAGTVIAIPIAWYGLHLWLEKFAYKIDVGFGIFLLAGSITFIVALITVSWQSFRAAIINPVESLRSE